MVKTAFSFNCNPAGGLLCFFFVFFFSSQVVVVRFCAFLGKTQCYILQIGASNEAELK